MFNIFKATALAAAAGLVCSSALAAPPANLQSTNSALAFIAIDQAGTPTSLFVDLGFSFTDFNLGSAFYTPDQKVVWDFNTNKVSVNGVDKPGTYNWSSQYAIFQGAAQAADTTFAVIGGTAREYPTSYLTTGTPTAAEFDALTLERTSNMGQVQNLYVFNGVSSTSTFSQPGFGANAYLASNIGSGGYVGDTDKFGPGGDWTLQLTWNALKPEGQTTNIYAMNDDFDNPINKKALTGTFDYSQGVLTFNSPITTPIPEPSALMMTLAGISVLYGVGRRRREER
jgi:hypothetical protein